VITATVMPLSGREFLILFTALMLLLLNHLFVFCYGTAVIEIMVLFVCDIQVCI